ncbi:hypothetical protein ACNOYE_32910 [Nannocystaceae bacterium ST9]
MSRKLALLSLLFALPTALAGCPSDDGGTDEVGDTGDETGETGDTSADPCDPAAGTLDEAACMPAPGDYVPGADDDYAACISDAGTYELVADPPGSIARIEAYEDIAELLWLAGVPSAEDFTMARTAYEIDEGLGSRVDRREDLHYPEIPMAEWDPGLDPDKQCSNTDLAAAYPDRCVGPAQMRPILSQAFIDGMSGTGDPNVHAAKIKGTLLWFLYLSIYKEANTCFTVAAKDCDSAWAYYTGGAQADAAVIGFAKFVAEYSDNTNTRINDALLAVRCVRDLYPEDMYPLLADLPQEGQDLFAQAWEQLDEALHRGLAIVVRQHAAAQDSCGGAATANWELVKIVGGALQREAGERDSAAASELEALYALSEPTAEDNARIVELIDQVFPCP